MSKLAKILTASKRIASNHLARINKNFNVSIYSLEILAPSASMMLLGVGILLSSSLNDVGKSECIGKCLVMIEIYACSWFLTPAMDHVYRRMIHSLGYISTH